MGIAGSVVLSALLAGIISIDRSAFGQFQISRPLVAAPIMGFVLGCPAEGALIGLAYELLFLRSLPVGSFIPAHPLFPSLVSVLLVGTYSGPESGTALIGPAILFGLPATALDQAVNVLWRRSNEGTFYRAESYVRLGREKLAERAHLFALARAGVFHAVAFLLSGGIIVPLFGAVMGEFKNLAGLLAVVAVVPFLTGLAGLAADRTDRRGWLGFASGLAVGIGTGVWRMLA
ncbi:MAG: PTS sugar transporter subunit IIC [bacterium]|nr:PTS sugar transporter subunit IIC [bacterium]MDT8394905.1 PTS sugar transporter subunit IIC [bacterium]